MSVVFIIDDTKGLFPDRFNSPKQRFIRTGRENKESIQDVGVNHGIVKSKADVPGSVKIFGRFNKKQVTIEFANQ